MPDDNGATGVPLIENQKLPPRWAVIVTMNEAGGVSVESRCPSPDIAWMLLARALLYVERESLAARTAQVLHDREPRVVPATAFGRRPPV